MSEKERETVQPGVMIDSAVWSEFRQDVIERRGRVRGHLGSELENAIREYIDASHGGDVNDRLARLEQQIEQLAAGVGDRDGGADEKRKNEASVSTEVENKLQRIAEFIDDKTDSPKVNEIVVNRAIEAHAGLSDPTLRRYKELLETREILYPHPNDSERWYTNGRDFAQATNAMAKGGKLSQQAYNDLVNQYGAEWWAEQLDQDTDRDRGGFQ